MTGNSASPFAPIHPGELLRDDTMPSHGWNIETLAKKLDVDEQKVNDLINERIPIDQDLSERLGKALDIDKDCWLGIQQNYEMKILENELKIKMNAAGTPLKFVELNKQKTVLAAFSATRPNAKIGSVHAQKIIFKIDREIDKSNVWIPDFKFAPYKHGPFYHEINSILNRLVDEKLVDITFPSDTLEWTKRKYALNAQGRAIGLNFWQKCRVMPKAR